MGFAKREMERNEAMQGVAIGIAVECGALNFCEAHEIAYAGDGDIEAACELGNKKFDAGELEGDFENKQEVADKIKEAVEEHIADLCPRCEKNLAD